MTLGRMEVRHAVRDRLIGKTVAGDRVYTTRKRALWKAGLPALVIYTVEELEPEIKGEGEAPLWHRQLMVAVDVVVNDKDGVPDDAVDELCDQVETAIFGGERFIGTEHVVGLAHAGVQFRFEGRASSMLGAARILMSIPYEWTIEVDPATSAPWTLLATDWDLPTPDGVPEAVDLQELEQ